MLQKERKKYSYELSLFRKILKILVSERKKDERKKNKLL